MTSAELPFCVGVRASFRCIHPEGSVATSEGVGGGERGADPGGGPGKRRQTTAKMLLLASRQRPH